MSGPRRWNCRVLVALATVLVLACGSRPAPAAPNGGDANPLAYLEEQVASHPGQSGIYVLESSEEALIARAWLTEQARESIDVQYFIWSTDNIGILAAEALLRAAERGVRVRVLVDDFMMEAPDRSLLAMAAHPGIAIRIYNPNTSVGVSFLEKTWNALTDLRGVNQRMHDKTFVVDGKVAITGGRNMAAEYYDYHHQYNFRDRDVLLAGQVLADLSASFERFWASDLSAAVESLGENGTGLSESEVLEVHGQLHAYAKDPGNFAPSVRRAVESAATSFPRLARQATWGRIDFVCDDPGKNDGSDGLGGGGRSTRTLARLVAGASRSIVIQSPYLVLSDAALRLFRNARERGVRIRVSTNSLASTDNLQAFAGYRNQRDQLLAMGLEIYEYRPDAQTPRLTRQSELVGDLPAADHPSPIFGLHAKSMVVDSVIAYVGTFNLDPRSENLNTEVGVVVHEPAMARRLEAAIEDDMRPANSWDAARDHPDGYVPASKRRWVRFWQWMPIRSFL